VYDALFATHRLVFFFLEALTDSNGTSFYNLISTLHSKKKIYELIGFCGHKFLKLFFLFFKSMEIEQVMSDRDSEDEVDDDVADFEDRRVCLMITLPNSSSLLLYDAILNHVCAYFIHVTFLHWIDFLS